MQLIKLLSSSEDPSQQLQSDILSATKFSNECGSQYLGMQSMLHIIYIYIYHIVTVKGKTEHLLHHVLSLGL